MKHATLAELRAAIERECTQIPRGLLSDACDSIASRCQQGLDQQGRQSENWW